MDWRPGQAVEWLYRCQGCYGPRWWVPATVVRVGAKRVTVDARRRDGTTLRRNVQAERLRAAGVAA